ncbi:MAG: MFS transporter [Victivallaceae bacterium]|jgi:hypothetical protein
MNFRDRIPWSEREAKRAERNAALACSCAAMGEVSFTDAAIIIIYANMLGASDAVSMITTSFLSLFTGLFVIPASRIVLKGSSYQRTIMISTFFGMMMFMLVVLAPLFGSFALPVLLTALGFFALSNTVYIASWFPMLDTFVTAKRRSTYLARMRFSWQLASAVLLMGISAFIGQNPSMQTLQAVMLLGALIFFGKMFFISKIPQFDVADKADAFSTGLKKALANKPLAGYSVYLFALNLAAYGTIPLATLYLKKALFVPDNVIVLISSIVLIGMLAGSFCAGNIISRWGIRRILLLVHISYALVNTALFLSGRSLLAGNALYFLIAGLLFIYSFTFACANIASSSEMMALASRGNKVMAMAFCNSFYQAGSGLSRVMTSLILASGALASHWSIGDWQFTHYQTLFLIYAVCIVFAASLLIIVPAVFPKGEYIYAVHN